METPSSNEFHLKGLSSAVLSSIFVDLEMRNAGSVEGRYAVSELDDIRFVRAMSRGGSYEVQRRDWHIAAAGTCSSASVISASRAASMAPWARPMASAKHANTVSCAVKALVEATATSGPAIVSSTASLSRAIVLSGTFSTDNIGTFCSRMYFIAASASAVSPDCDTSTPSVPRPKGGRR